MSNDTMQDIINRIKTRRIELEYSFQDLADLTSLSKSTLQRYEAGGIKNIPLDKLKILAKALNVTPEWIMGWEEVSENVTTNSGVKIPVLGRVAAGIPLEAIEDIEDYEEIPKEMSDHAEYFALRIHGESMEPKFSDGDVVIVKRQDDVESGDIAVVIVNGTDATVKRVMKQENGIMLIATNQSVFPPKFYDNKAVEDLPVRIIGKVVELRAKF